MQNETKKFFNRLAVMDTQVKSTTDISTWFEKLVNSMRKDVEMFKLGIDNSGKTELLDAAFNNDHDKMNSIMRESSQLHFVQGLMKSYIEELNHHSCKPLNIAFDLNNDEILVWAVIKDDDEETEKKLWLSEAKTNFNFHKYGFNLSTTIVEESDKITIPAHYISFNK